MVSEGFRTSPTLEAAVARSQPGTRRFLRERVPPNTFGRWRRRRASARRAIRAASLPLDSWLSTNASWEIDLFGAVRRGNEGALARAAAQQATLADVRVSLAADITDAYLSFRALPVERRAQRAGRGFAGSDRKTDRRQYHRRFHRALPGDPQQGVGGRGKSPARVDTRLLLAPGEPADAP